MVTDVNPYDLPPNAFSAAKNVVFQNNRISRGPVFKMLFSPMRTAQPYDTAPGNYDSSTGTYDAASGGPSTAARFVGSYADPINGETVFICDNDGTVRTYPNTNLAFATPGSGQVTNDNPWSHAMVAGHSILARQGMQPYIRNLSTDANYSLIGGDWVATDTASVVRPFLDFILMLNVNKASGNYPTMVKWCNPVQYGAATSTITWDPANTNYVSGENVLGELKSPIRDGLVLGNAFIIYAQSQVFLMEYTGSQAVFNFRRLFPDGGILNTNCVVEADGRHFVFGENDVYVHDGIQKQSIADGRVRRRIYSVLDRSKQTSCFTVHDSVNSLIHFCYPSLEDEASFKHTQFCNASATYNYKSDTWTFLDLPNIVGGAEANVSLLQSTFDMVTGSYAAYNTAYVSFTNTTPRFSIMLGIADPNNGLTDSRIYAVDLPSTGLVDLPAHPETLKTAYVERVGIDLDEQTVGALPLRSYKTITCIIPQCDFDDSNGYFTVAVGAADLPSAGINYTSVQDYNPSTGYKLDMKVSGRYLGFKVSTNSISNFKFSGFDAEVKSLSRR